MKAVNYLLAAVIGANILAGGIIYLPVTLESRQQIKSTSSKDQVICKNEALKIALEAAGINKDQATDIEIKLEEGSSRLSNNRHPYVYEIEFKYNGYEYEYEIDAITKQVLRSEIDRID